MTVKMKPLPNELIDALLGDGANAVLIQAADFN